MFSRLAHAWGRRFRRIPADTDPTPTITSIADYTVACGASVVITGTGFLGTSPRAGAGFVKTVHIGTTSVSYTVDSATQITAVAPDTPGDKSVVINTSGGCATHGTPLQVRPRIDSVTPASISSSGGVFVTLTGAGFTGATAVDVSGVAATFDQVTDASMRALAPFVPALAGGGTAAVTVTSTYASDAADLEYTP